MTDTSMLKFQYTQMLDQLILLQLHAEDSNCPCSLTGTKQGELGEYCEPKHLRAVVALARETIVMEEDEARVSYLEALVFDGTELLAKMEAKLCGKEVELGEYASWARDKRKPIEEWCYASFCEVASSTEVGLAEFVRAREAQLAEGLGAAVITGLGIGAGFKIIDEIAKFIKKQEVAKMGRDEFMGYAEGKRIYDLAMEMKKAGRNLDEPATGKDITFRDLSPFDQAFSFVGNYTASGNKEMARVYTGLAKALVELQAEPSLFEGAEMGDSKFSRRHYEAIAGVIYFNLKVSTHVKEHIADKFAKMLTRDNPAFDREKFMKAAVGGALVQEAEMGAPPPREIPIKWENSEWGLRAEVFPVSGDAQVRITIDRSKKYGSPELGKAEVNWQSLGSQSVAVTNEFAEGLLYAKAVAQAMMGRVYLYSVIYKRDGAVMQTSVMGNNEEQVRLGLPPEIEVQSITKGEQVSSAIVEDSAPYGTKIPKEIVIFKSTIEKHYLPATAFHGGSIRIVKPTPEILVTLGCLKKDDWDAKSTTCTPNLTLLSTIVPKTKEYINEAEKLKRDHPKISVKFREEKVGIEPRVEEDEELKEVVKALGEAEVISGE